MTEDLLMKLEVRADMLLDRLEKTEPGSKEEQTVAEDVNKLFDILNREYEISNRLVFEQERLEIDKQRLDIDQKRAAIEELRAHRNDIFDRVFEGLKIGTTVGTFAIGQKAISDRWLQGLNFETTGSIGSAMVRSQVNGITKV